MTVITGPFLLALAIVSLISATMIGFGVQWAASEFDFGPAPRAFIGFAIIIPSVLLKVFELGIYRLLIPLLVIYYFGTFQIGKNLGILVGMESPDKNDPPDIFFKLANYFED